jgi:peptidoglycan hydrolase-like protein with peptidoglycan-binding domain
MDSFRSSVTEILNGSAKDPILIPSVEPVGPQGNPEGRPTLRRGESGELVELVQMKIKVKTDGTFGPKTEAALRAFQREHLLVADGIVGPKTWKKLDAV